MTLESETFQKGVGIGEVGSTSFRENASIIPKKVLEIMLQHFPKQCNNVLGMVVNAPKGSIRRLPSPDVWQQPPKVQQSGTGT